MKWIKCSDRLPEAHQTVVIIVGGQYEVGHRLIGSNYFSCGTSQYDVNDVMYWTDLPDMPKPEDDYFKKWCMLKNYIITHVKVWNMPIESKWAYDRMVKEMDFIERHNRASN